jgi:CheY-like chemotaxis protein
MAQILISESHEDVRRMLKRMVTRLGHEAILDAADAPEQLQSADLLIVEPTAPVGAMLARTAHSSTPNLPIICASVAAPPAELAQAGVVFAADLRKPFTLEQLAGAIERAQSA